MDISKQSTSTISPTSDALLSRLSIDSTGTVLVYVVSERWAFTIPFDDLYDAHVAEVEVGAHPYAEPTLALYTRTLTVRPFLGNVNEDYLQLVVSDWMDWVDDVISHASEDCFDDENPTDSDIHHAMKFVGRIHGGMSDLVESVRDAA